VTADRDGDRPEPPNAGSDNAGADRARIAELEEQLRLLTERSAATQRRLERDVDRGLRMVRDRDRAVAEARQDYERLRNRKIVRLGLRSVRVLEVPIHWARRQRGTAIRLARGVARRLGLRRLLRASRSGPGRDQLVASLRAALPPAPEASGSVSVIIDSRTDPSVLAACIEAMQSTEWDDLEVLVAGPNADNQVRAATHGDQRSPGGRRRVRPVTGASAADSRREAIQISTGELLVLIHDDVRPIEPTWLRRMVATLRSSGAGAVGARLLVAPGGGGDRDSGFVDLRVAHRGIDFDTVEGFPRPRPVGRGEDPLAAGSDAIAEWPAASEACLLIERATLDALGSPPHTTDDPEPIELCLRLQEAGRKVVVDGTAVLWHRYPAREVEAPPEPLPGEVDALADHWGPRLYRSVLLDRLAAGGRWSSSPLRVGITLSKDDERAAFGDWYTAHELGAALEGLGWRVGYLERERDRWYETAGDYDVIVSLLERFDLFRIPRGVITVAWIRNWTEEWTAKPWFDNYDLVLASSQRSKELVEAQSAKVAHVFPIATNPERFKPGPARDDLATDAVFVGNHWNVPRGIDAALPAVAAAGHRVAIYGRGWDDEAASARLWRGQRAYDDLPDVYASATLAIDDAAISTKPYGSMNSRVFDALANGTLVVTDNELGARELFDAEFPVWSDAEDLVDVVGRLMADGDRRRELTERYRRIVLDRHTYAHRARELRDLLGDWALAPKVAAHIGPQSWELGKTWGDIPFGRDVQRQLERRGHPTALLVHDEQGSAAAIRADIALHIFGVRAPRTLGSQINALWVISHPDRVTEALCELYNVVFLASDILLEHLARRVQVPLVPLHQATEPSRFFREPGGPHHQLLFVGNSRGVRRPIIEDLRGTSWDLAVYGGGWTSELLDPRHLRGQWVSNDELRRYYSAAEIVLNDHWGDMREGGIISNRVYDALACGAFVVSDRVPGIDEEFDGAVATYESREQLLALVERYLGDEAARAEAGQRGRAAVLARHTFAQRVEVMLAELGPLLGDLERTVGPGMASPGASAPSPSSPAPAMAAAAAAATPGA